LKVRYIYTCFYFSMSASCHQLFVPRHRRSMFGRQAFSVAGPAAWNSLPDYLRDPSRSFRQFSQGPENFSFLVLLAYTSHYRLCDYALYKYTTDNDSFDTDVVSVCWSRHNVDIIFTPHRPQQSPPRLHAGRASLKQLSVGCGAE